MLKLNRFALVLFAILMGLVSVSKADTVFSTAAPVALKMSEVQALPEFYKCSLVKRGPNFNPVKAGPTIFAKSAPAPDDKAIVLLDDKKNKVYKCELTEVNLTNGRTRKVKDNS